MLGAQRGVLGAARTGDDKNMLAWLGVMLSGIAALVGYILFMMRKRRNGKAAE